jgi:hypothetical protein
MTSEVHVFILWEKALTQKEIILRDIADSFDLLNVIEIEWSQEHFSNNLSRFYGQKLPDGSFKEKHCGRGSFYLVIVRDNQPKYKHRLTSRGREESVNTNMFDKKQLYRSWTGGGHRVHGTDNVGETSHNIKLLLDHDYNEYERLNKNWSGEIINLKRDLTGYNGWDKIEDIFSVLNVTSDYVILRNFECFPDQYTMEEHGDIDFLSDKPIDLAYILNGKKVYKQGFRRHYVTKIAGEDVYFDARGIDDGYYDKKWACNILESKQFVKNLFYTPGSHNLYYSMLYHALVHKKELSVDYSIRLNHLNSNVQAVGLEEFSQQLDKFMKVNNYSYSEPNDYSVFFNTVVTKSRTSYKRRLRILISTVKSLIKHLIKPPI